MQERLARRKGTCIGLMMIDADHFKAFNDTFGHDAGDQVLREIAGALRSHTRGEDVACRYGGEELCVVLPGATPEITLNRAEQLRGSVAALLPERGGVSLGQATVSIGVANFPVHGATWRDVLLAADAALYQAKQQGRNRVVVAGEQPDSGKGVTPLQE